MATSNQPHKCDKVCFVCERPYDVFSHVHIQPIAAFPHAESYDGPEMVFCIPCIAQLSNMLDLPITAYHNGGHVFDAWANKKRRQARGQGGGTAAPPWLVDALEDIFRQQKPQEDPDA